MKSSAGQAGRQDWEEAFRSLYDPLWRRLSLIYGDSFIAEEAVQEAFYRAMCRWHKFEDLKRLEAWLFVVARNVARDLFRRLSRAATLDDSGITAETDPTPHTFSVEEVVESRLTAKEVAEAIMRLPPTHREVLFLYYYEGCTVEEIAARTRISVGTVKSRLFRARQALRAALDGHVAQQEQARIERGEPREPEAPLSGLA